jgi:hypothetical protein
MLPKRMDKKEKIYKRRMCKREYRRTLRNYLLPLSLKVSARATGARQQKTPPPAEGLRWS